MTDNVIPFRRHVRVLGKPATVIRIFNGRALIEQETPLGTEQRIARLADFERVYEGAPCDTQNDGAA